MLQHQAEIFADEEVFHSNLHFEQEWCEKFLKHSGQSTHYLHRISGKRLVQTAAILAKIESEIIFRLGDYRFISVNMDASKQLVFIDDELLMQVRRHNKRGMIFDLHVLLTRKGEQVMEAHATVVDPAAGDWQA